MAISNNKNLLAHQNLLKRFGAVTNLRPFPSKIKMQIYACVYICVCVCVCVCVERERERDLKEIRQRSFSTYKKEEFSMDIHQ